MRHWHSAHAFSCVDLSLLPFLIQSRENVTRKRVRTLKLDPQDGQDKVTQFLLGPLLGEQTPGPKRLSWLGATQSSQP